MSFDFIKNLTKTLNESEIDHIMRNLVVRAYQFNDLLCEYGKPAGNFYMIIKGKVGVLEPNRVSKRFNDYY